ncbi:hypothetical protein [Propionivibrio sp.]|uniref:hypothetical protein n=1 Tax=Propionivibrio sp. TaxID=2212460 RepID=UPI003BF23DC0
MATNAENNSEPQRYSESDLKKLKTWSLESRAHQALKDYRVKWEAVRDEPSSTPADVRLACLILNQPPEAEQRRIEAESRIWTHESELRDLIAELHPGEDGGLMLKKLDAFVKDENTRILVAELAVKHADEHLSAEKSNKAEIAKKIDNEIYAFFPLHTIEGGDGRVKRLQWVAAPEPNITTPVPAQTTATPTPAASNGPSKSNKTSTTLIFEAKVIELMGKFWNDKPANTKPNKSDLCKKVYAEMLRGSIRGSRAFTEGMVRDAAKPWKFPIDLPTFVQDSKFNEKRHPFKGEK